MTIPISLTRPRHDTAITQAASARRRTWRIARNTLVALVLFIVIGNVTILALNRSARARVGVDRIDGIEGIHNLRVVDDRVWGGGNPTHEAIEALAQHGVTTIVDLRAEPYRYDEDEFIRAHGVE